MNGIEKRLAALEDRRGQVEFTIAEPAPLGETRVESEARVSRELAAGGFTFALDSPGIDDAASAEAEP